MKTYTLSLASAFTHKPEYPERTARKEGTGTNFDVTFKVWPSREALLKTCAMQRKRAPHPTDWQPCVKPSYW